MHDFNIERFCEDTGFSKDQVEKTISAASDHIYRLAFSRFVGSSAPLTEAIADAVSKKISGKSGSVVLTDGKKNKKSGRGEFYAPYKEVITCHAARSFPNSNGTATIVFESVNAREYGNGEPIKFEHSVVMTSQEVVSLFYLLGGAEVIPSYKVREDVLQNIPNIPDPSDIPNLFTTFLYNIDIKRVVADYRDPVKVLSITPCGVIQNAKHEL